MLLLCLLVWVFDLEGGELLTSIIFTIIMSIMYFEIQNLKILCALTCVQMLSLDRGFEYGRQQDAHELLMCVLDTMEKDSKRALGPVSALGVSLSGLPHVSHLLCLHNTCQPGYDQDQSVHVRFHLFGCDVCLPGSTATIMTCGSGSSCCVPEVCS